MKRIALITGGTSGIGFEAAKRLIKKNCNLHLVYRNDHKKAENARKELLTLNSNIQITTEAKDFSKQDNVINFCNSFLETYSDYTLDTIVSSHGQILPGLFLQKKIESILEVINEHLISNVILTRLLLHKMCVQKFGRFVFITSLASHKINQGQADYALSKASLEILVKSLTSEYFQRNITFNCICAGLTNTRVLTKVAEEMLKTNPNSVVSVEQVGDLIELLTQEKSQYISGSTFLVDAGQFCRNNNLGYHKLSFYAKNEDEKY